MDPKEYKDLDFSKLSKDEIVNIQKDLIKNGYLDKTFVNARGETKDSADGFWGNRSQSAMKKFLESLEKPNGNSSENEEESSNPLQGTRQFLWDIGRAKTSRNVPKDYMSQTRSGRATPEDIARERMSTVGSYITDDFGHDTSYKTAEYQPEATRTVGAETTQALKEQFDKDWTAAGNQVGTLYHDVAPSHGPIAPEYIIDAEEDSAGNFELSLNPTAFDPENNRYQRKLQRYVDNTPATVAVQTHNLTANGSQEQLSDTDRKQWTQEYNTELLQNAELYSQLNAARAAMDSALSDDQYNEAKQQYDDLAHRIAMNNNAESFSLHGQKTLSFPSEYNDLIKRAESGDFSEEVRNGLQEMYDRYGASPQWSSMPWGEKYTLDHLHGAGYSYNDENGEGNSTVGEIGQKLTDAINGQFNPRTLNGDDNGDFVLRGDRQGVHRHLTQRGENVTNWQYNQAPKDASGKPMDKPYFEIGKSMAWDWSNGTPRVALSTTDNYHYGTHQQNNPLFTDSSLYNNPFKDKDWSTFDQWSNEEKKAAGDWLKGRGFNVEDKSTLSGIKSMLKTGEVPYDWNAVKSLYQSIQKTKESLSNPTEGQQSGENSFYHLPMSQGNKYTSNIFGNSIAGVQIIDGKPHSFNQDVYDISTGPLQMFGEGTWYRNTKPISEQVWNQMKRSAQE